MTKKRKKSTKTEIKEVIRRLYRLVERYYKEEGIESSDNWRHYGNVRIAEDSTTGDRVCYLTVKNRHGGYTDIKGFKKG